VLARHFTRLSSNGGQHFSSMFNICQGRLEQTSSKLVAVARTSTDFHVLSRTRAVIFSEREQQMTSGFTQTFLVTPAAGSD
jgi:hypothetical protein